MDIVVTSDKMPCKGETIGSIPVLLNPSPALAMSSELIDKVTYLIPNEHEVKKVFQTEADIENLMHRYPNKLIITFGKNGVKYSNGKSIICVPAIEAEVVDTTGAGDTFTGAFAKSVSEGSTLYDAIIFAQYAGGLSVEKMGAQGGMPTLIEVKGRMVTST